MSQPTLPPDDSAVRRLVFVRLLSRLAADQAQAPEPLCFAALLTMHDCVELFLHLAAERLNIGKKRTEFMQYFELIEPVLGEPLAQRETMRRLNSARVALKHHGTQPGRREVGTFAVAVEDFLSSNAPRVFGLDIGAISLAQLVTEETVRASLERADNQFEQGDIPEALVSIAEAFARLLKAYRVGSTLTRNLEEAARQLDRAIGSAYSRGPAGKMAKAIEELADEVALLRHGVDTRDLTLFRSLTPTVAIAMAGNAQAVWAHDSSSITARDARLCYDFVVDSALRIQAGHSWMSEVGGRRYFGSAFGNV
jgi:hypothetical protein